MDIKEIKKVIPSEKIYDDAFSPAMKQIGKALEGVTKTARFILAPIDYIASHHKRWEKYLEKIAEKVSEEDLAEGHPQIVIPTIEGLSLSYENTLLSEFFVNLLANSIDKTKQDYAHPAFPNLIKQISHDEAVVLYFLKKKSFKLIEQSDLSDDNRFYGRKIVEEEFPIDKLQFPKRLWLYMNHLHSLNLAGTWEIKNQEPMYDNEKNKQIGVKIYSERKLTEFGNFFVTACVPDNFENL